ncbi:hypothetical protein, partial [Bacillus sp. 0909A]|uniref:hypothetical protein n=1 Tax=Bacillus sp. 0909A TaxID=3120561 RepID=UPI002FDA3AAD
RCFEKHYFFKYKKEPIKFDRLSLQVLMFEVALPATLNKHLRAKKDLLWLNFVLSSFQEPSNN